MSLESTIEAEISKPEPKDGVVRKLIAEGKHYLADTSYYIATGTLAFAVIEYAIGMTQDQIITSRLGMGAFQMVASYPYGKFRNYLASKFKVSGESSGWKKAAAEIGSGILFYSPAYTAWNYMNGVPLETVLAGAGIGVVSTAIMSFPQNYFADKWRRVCGVKPAIH